MKPVRNRAPGGLARGRTPLDGKDLDAALPPPSLTYGGEPVSAAAWSVDVVSEEETAEGRRTVREFAAPDGLLKVRTTLLEYRDFPAVR